MQTASRMVLGHVHGLPRLCEQRCSKPSVLPVWPAAGLQPARATVLTRDLLIVQIDGSLRSPIWAAPARHGGKGELLQLAARGLFD